jgi:hypothetical protein
MYFIQHCFLGRPSDYTVSEDAEIEPRTVATSALAVRRSSHSAKSHPQNRTLKKVLILPFRSGPENGHGLLCVVVAGGGGVGGEERDGEGDGEGGWRGNAMNMFRL